MPEVKLEASADSRSLDESLRIFKVDNAEPWAAALFRERFNAPFPVPRDNCGLPIPTPPENWRQYVAVYTWPDGREETVGFCNWIRYRDVYLHGGLCVKADFYRRLPKRQFDEMHARGRLGEIIVRAAMPHLTDCTAWFGHCGDPKALAVDLRTGYEFTRHKYLLVMWFNPPPLAERDALIDSMAAIGPF